MSKLGDSLLEFLNPSIPRRFLEFYREQPEVVQFFLNLNHVKGDVPYFWKKHVVKNQGTIIELYRDEKIKLNKSINDHFKSQILENKLRSRFLNDFTNTYKLNCQNIHDKKYCLDHIREFDSFINNLIAAKNAELKNKYQNGYALYWYCHNPKAVDVIDKEDVIAKYDQNYFKYETGRITQLSKAYFPGFVLEEKCHHLNDWRLDNNIMTYNFVNQNGDLVKARNNYMHLYYECFSRIYDTKLAYDNKYKKYVDVCHIRHSEIQYDEAIIKKISSFTKSMHYFYEAAIERLGVDECYFNILLADDEIYPHANLLTYFKPLINELGKSNYTIGKNVYYDYNQLLESNKKLDCENNIIAQIVVVIKFVSSDHSVGHLCSKIVNDCNIISFVVFISLIKEIDSGKINEIVKEEWANIENFKKKEAEEHERIQRERKEEEDRKIQAVQNVKELYRCVRNWDTLSYVLKYFSAYNYYPTTCDFDVSEKDWSYRRLIWNFKNDVTKVSKLEHELALDQVLKLMEYVIGETFGRYTKTLTLVCIPASTVNDNINRYSEFSRRLCESLGMEDAFPHIKIVKEKVPKHKGGTGRAEITCTSDFFVGKNVLLFDDIITKGNSMLQWTGTLRSKKANVIAGISIGITRHTINVHPIDRFPD